MSSRSIAVGVILAILALGITSPFSEATRGAEDGEPAIGVPGDDEAEPRFTISGTFDGSDVGIDLDALDSGIWPDHAGLMPLADFTDAPFSVDVVDGCSTNGHFWLYVRGALDDYELTLTDRVTGKSKGYASASDLESDGAEGPLSFLDTSALATCTSGEKAARLPKRISGRATQKLVSGPNSCGKSFKNKFTINDTKKKTSYTRDFGRGLKSDLPLIGSDAASGSAVFGDKDKNFDAAMFLWLADDMVWGLLAEGPNGVYPPADTRSLVGPRPEGDELEALIDRLGDPPGSCVWTTTHKFDKKGQRVLEHFWLDFIGSSENPGDSAVTADDGRFSVSIDWATPTGSGSDGGVVQVSSADDGLYYFFDPQNWEMLVKVLDSCAATGHYWVFAAARTDVEYTLTVTDTQTSTTRAYGNDLGQRAAAVTDTQAFATCP